jgi:ABC-type dipeptide/oligopeptide/nickel transport system permease subunit
LAFSQSLWKDAWQKIKKDKLALICVSITLSYVVVAILVSCGVLASQWSTPVGGSYDAPNWNAWLGTDIFGRDVFSKMLVGTKVALSVGLVTVLISIPIGFILGAIAGYFGGIVDEIIVWFYTTLSSIPGIMLLISITFILGKGLVAMYIALGLTSWVGLCRMIRAEVMKHKNRDYVLAAEVVGVGTWGRLLRHILPNVFHIIIIDASLTFQMAIKSEVILSYLGLGVQDEPSWGKMIDDAKLELARDVWWQLGAATAAMFIILIALNFLGDILRDALDPKLKGRG